MKRISEYQRKLEETGDNGGLEIADAGKWGTDGVTLKKPPTGAAILSKCLSRSE